jgi:hypothetical protein
VETGNMVRDEGQTRVGRCGDSADETGARQKARDTADRQRYRGGWRRRRRKRGTLRGRGDQAVDFDITIPPDRSAKGRPECIGAGCPLRSSLLRGGTVNAGPLMAKVRVTMYGHAGTCGVVGDSSCAQGGAAPDADAAARRSQGLPEAFFSRLHRLTAGARFI